MNENDMEVPSPRYSGCLNEGFDSYGEGLRLQDNGRAAESSQHANY